MTLYTEFFPRKMKTLGGGAVVRWLSGKAERGAFAARDSWYADAWSSFFPFLGGFSAESFLISFFSVSARQD
jgi:hypothetical protein